MNNNFNIDTYKVYVFDLDGTLLNSMEQKAESFALATIKIFPELINKKEEVKTIYKRTRGTPRNIQLSLVLHEMGLPPLAEQELEIWSKYFSEMYIPQKTVLFEGVEELLLKLKNSGKKVVISTGAPQQEVEEIVKIHNLENIVDLTCGHKDTDFSKGKGHFEYIKKHLNVQDEDIVFIADGEKDIQIAKNNHVAIIAVANTDDDNTITALKNMSPDLLYTKISEIYV